MIGTGSSPAWFTGAQLKYSFSRLHEEVERLRGRWLSAPAFVDKLVRKHVPPLGEPETSEISQSTEHPGSYLPRMIEAAGFARVSYRFIHFASHGRAARQRPVARTEKQRTMNNPCLSLRSTSELPERISATSTPEFARLAA